MHHIRLLVFAIAAFLLAASAAVAHPLGNFTINHLVRVQPERGSLRVSYVLDEAEIPAFSVLRSLEVNARPDRPTLEAWGREQSLLHEHDLLVAIDDRPVVLIPRTSSVSTRAGAGGLRTLYLRVAYTVRIEPGPHHVLVRDSSYRGRIGWHDIAFGSEREPTDELRRYPPALLGSPRDRTARAVSVDSNGALFGATDSPPAAPASTPSFARSSALSDALSRGAGSPLIVLAALLLAIGLGGLHALEPGHGKTLLAVSLVGARATSRQALIVATALTAAHTLGVLALGALVLLAARWIVPETIYPWLTLVSGAVIAWLGARALATAVASRRNLAHTHAHEHSHAHPHAHDHVHSPGRHHHGENALDDAEHARMHAIPGTAPLSFGGALLAAVSGNIAPCPAALVVLLAAISLHELAYGLLLIVAFSLGLALVLTALGLAVVRGAAWLSANPRFERAARFGPLVTASVISVIGATLLGQGLAQENAGAPQLLITGLVLAAIGGFALSGPHGSRIHRHGSDLGRHAEVRG